MFTSLDALEYQNGMVSIENQNEWISYYAIWNVFYSIWARKGQE